MIMKRILSFFMLAIAFSTNLMSQNTKVTEKDLKGVWLMESMQWEGEKKTECGKKSGYSQFKYYGSTGEYANAEIALSKDGKVVVLPHEYGQYTYKNGVYTEMGRSSKDADLILVDKNTFKSRWKNRHEVWKKCTSMPEKTASYIIERCKANQGPSADIQKSIIQSVFSK